MISLSTLMDSCKERVRVMSLFPRGFVEVGGKVNPVLVPVCVSVGASCSSITVKGGADCDLASSCIRAGGCCGLGVQTESAFPKHSIPSLFFSIVWSFSC